PAMSQWIAACKGGPQSPGSFVNAWPITEAVNLWAVALRTGRKIVYDADSMKITNVPDANKYLSREYRKGWDPQSI
ncbi:MAG: gfo/Idh/MocA family oxidoreductase, partial [Bryobacteraceae bacterium]